jgi:hypothetical protein
MQVEKKRIRLRTARSLIYIPKTARKKSDSGKNQFIERIPVTNKHSNTTNKRSTPADHKNFP